MDYNLDQDLADYDSEFCPEIYLNETYMDSMFVNKEPMSSSEMVELYISKSQEKVRKHVTLKKSFLTSTCIGLAHNIFFSSSGQVLDRIKLEQVKLK